MKIQGQGQRLRVYVGDADHWQGKPLYHAIVLKARELGLAGATVMRGFEGFGAHSRIKTAGLVDLSADLPVVVEIIDSEERIAKLLPHLDAMVTEGLITLDPVRIVKYAHRQGGG